MNADQLYQLPLAVIGITLAVVLLPMLSRRVKEGDEVGAARAIDRSLELFGLAVLPGSDGVYCDGRADLRCVVSRAGQVMHCRFLGPGNRPLPSMT